MNNEFADYFNAMQAPVSFARNYSAHRDFLASVTVTAFLSQFLNQIFLG